VFVICELAPAGGFPGEEDWCEGFGGEEEVEDEGRPGHEEREPIAPTPRDTGGLGNPGAGGGEGERSCEIGFN
jgi:hypothetical protein